MHADGLNVCLLGLFSNDQHTCAVLQACMFRQSVRRAMKGITTKLEQVHGVSARAVGLHKLSLQIGMVTQQLAEVVNKLHVVSSCSSRTRKPGFCFSCFLLFCEQG